MTGKRQNVNNVEGKVEIKMEKFDNRHSVNADYRVAQTSVHVYVSDDRINM